MDLDEVIGELFHLQDYGMGERPVKLCIYGADGHQMTQVDLGEIRLGYDDGSPNQRCIELRGKVCQ